MDADQAMIAELMEEEANRLMAEEMQNNFYSGNESHGVGASDADKNIPSHFEADSFSNIRAGDSQFEE